jgi:hypothetical protein
VGEDSLWHIFLVSLTELLLFTLLKLAELEFGIPNAPAAGRLIISSTKSNAPSDLQLSLSTLLKDRTRLSLAAEADS